MRKLTADQWAEMRIAWEGEPLATLGDMARKYDVDKAEISRRARKEGWVKRGQLVAINEAAQRKADADSTGTQRKLNAVDLATRQESEDLRAAVLVRHRAEWAELEGSRKIALVAMRAAHQSGDRASWTIAKLAAETARANIQSLGVKQQGERKAWGLDVQGEEEIVIVNPRGLA